MNTLTDAQIAHNAMDVFYFLVIVASIAIIGWTLLNWKRS